MSSSTFNPLRTALRVGRGYRDAIERYLCSIGVSEKHRSSLASEIAAQCKVYLSLNPKYELDCEFPAWVQKEGLVPQLADPGRFKIKQLFKHQEQAILAIKEGQSTLITAGTGSGKTECFMIPVLDWCLQHNPGEGGIQAIFIYPMNALAGDQTERLRMAVSGTHLKYGIYVGSTPRRKSRFSADKRSNYDSSRIYTREEMHQHPPDLLLTNHVMLDRILSGTVAREMLERSRSSLRFVVIDELHTFRGARATHLKYLLRRLRDAVGAVPVLVGTSATLGDDKVAIEHFGSAIFDVPVHVVRADGEPNALPHRELPPVSPRANASGAELVRDGWLHAISDRLLAGKGIASYGDVLDTVQRQLPPESSLSPEDVVLRCLQASFDGESSDQLDFRVHIFLPKTESTLRRCFQCRRVIATTSSICPVCEVPAFPVSRDDPDSMLAIAKDNRLWPANFSNGVPFEGLPVLVRARSTGESSNKSVLHFTPGEISCDSVEIEFDPAGKLELQLSSGSDSLIRMTQGVWSDVSEVVSELLLKRPRDQRRLLAFQDNRESVSRTASEARDYFASTMFLELLSCCRAHIDGAQLPDAIHYLLKAADRFRANAAPGLESTVWGEFPFWLRREIVAGQNAAIALELNERVRIGEPAREILEIFLAERAIGGLPPFGSVADLEHMWFLRYSTARQKAIHIEPFRPPVDTSISPVSLGPDARKYAQLVKKLGAEKIRSIIQELLDSQRITVLENTSAIPLYVLRPELLTFKLALSPAPVTDEPLTEHWLRIGMHSSELQASECRATEASFRNGDLDFVVATPTLEMGIDIGDLDQVVMIGAPPLPSNYAQRAGRAGRKQESRSALIACLCAMDSDHDVMAFENPANVIAGVITPPEFDAMSSPVAVRHLRVWRYGIGAQPNALQRGRAAHLFGDALDVDRYLDKDFACEYAKALRGRSSLISEQEWLYKQGFFPDYGFNRDEVEVRGHTSRQKRRYTDNEEQSRFRNNSIATREKDIAYLKFCPGRIVPAAGAYWRLVTPTESDSYTLMEDGRSPEVRQYEWFTGKSEGFNVSQGMKSPRYSTSVHFDAIEFQPLTPSFAIGYSTKCQLAFINHGELSEGQVSPFIDHEQKPFRLGYALTRQVLAFRYSSALFGKGEQPLSFIAAAVRAMKESFGIAEDELRVCSGAEPSEVRETGSECYVLVYDADGNHSLPLREILESFEHRIIQQALSNVESCTHCKTGCLTCMHSFYCRFAGVQLSRRHAADFARYLLRQQRLKTPNPFSSDRTHDYQVTLRVQWKRPYLRFSTGTCVETLDAADVYQALADEVARIWQPGSEAIRLCVDGLDWIVNNLQKSAVEKGDAQFKALLFQLLRYRSYEAVKEKFA